MAVHTVSCILDYMWNCVLMVHMNGACTKIFKFCCNAVLVVHLSIEPLKLTIYQNMYVSP